MTDTSAAAKRPDTFVTILRARWIAKRNEFISGGTRQVFAEDEEQALAKVRREIRRTSEEVDSNERND
jgi:hypothetical protein